MNAVARLIAWIRPKPKTPEEVAAKQDAARVRDEMKSTQIGARSDPMQNYESQGRRR